MDTDADVLKTVKAGAMPSIEHRARDSSSRLTIGNSRVRSAVVYVAVAVGLVVATAILRGQAISDWGLLLNADEAQLMADGRAALLSPVPYARDRPRSEAGSAWKAVREMQFHQNGRCVIRFPGP